METFTLSHSLFEHLPIISKKKTPKVEWEFQDVCLQCEEWFGKNKIIWTIPYKKGVNENIIRYALKETMKRKIKDIRYFLKIVNNQISTSKQLTSKV